MQYRAYIQIKIGWNFLVSLIYIFLKVQEIKSKGYIPQGGKASDIYFAIKKKNKN